MAQSTEQLPNLREIMERERARLSERRRDVAAELVFIDAEIAGIEAYFNCHVTLISVPTTDTLSSVT